MAGNAAYSILVGAELDTKAIEEKLKSLEKGIKFKVDASGLDGIKKSADESANAMSNLGLTFQEANLILSKSTDVISTMVERVFALDDALTEFAKVSDLSGASLDKYVTKLEQMGSTVARTGSEMLQSVTEFRKNGFNDKDAANLGQIAEMYRNIADEAISSGESASFIISQMTAFDIGAESAQHIIDAVNEVSNQFSVSSSDISNNLGNMSAVMAQTGSSFEESLGIVWARSSKTR